MTADCPLTDEQKAIFDAIEKGKPEDALKLVENGVDVNCFDATGMPVLSAAAYKGFHDLVEACLFKGADVNRKAEGHGYTPLMFAALSGKPDVCKLLLDHGAKSYITNKIGKTACELAAFVGMHECVSIINNYIGMDEVDRLLNTKVDGEVLEKYPDELIVFIHDLCKTHQIHPVSLIFRFCEYPDAMKYKKKILYVIDRVFEKQLRSKESNEVMSLKLWMILFSMREVTKFVEEKSDKDPSEVAQSYAKWLLAWEPGAKVRLNLEKLLRNAVHSFPYRHSLLYETMVKAMSKVPVGERPSTFDFIVQGLFGQRILACSKFCSTCGRPAASKRCPACKLSYCSQKCQKFDWSIHKKCCASIKEWNQEVQEPEMSVEELQEQLAQVDV